MPASLLEYRLRVQTASTQANPDGTGDAFVISSIPADALPFLAGPPSGDGQEVDPITGAVRTGAYTVEIVDANTGTDGTGTIRALTNRLEDAGFRQQLISRRAIVEVRTDGGSYSPLISGYVLSVRLVSPVRYAMTIGDTRRVEQTQPIFTGSTLPPFTTRGCLTGGPLTLDWGPIKTRGGWRYRVTKLAGDDVELRLIEGYGNGADAPTIQDFRKVAQERRGVADVVATYAQPNPYAIGGTSQFVTAYTTPVHDANTGDWAIGGGIVPIVGTSATNGAAVRALVVGFSVLRTTDALGVSPLYLYWPSCPHSTGDLVYVSLTTFDVTERTPLYIDAHPVDVVTAIWTQARVRFDASTAPGSWIANMKSLIGDNVRIALRLTEAPIIAPFLESAIFGPFGIAARTTTAGLQELFPTRIRTDVLPTVTLGASSLRDTDALVFDLDEATAVSSVELTQTVFGQAVYVEGAAATGSSAPPFDGVMISKIAQKAQYIDSGITVFSGRNVAYELPGMIHTATDFAPNVGAQLNAIALAMFDRFGRGASVADAPVLAGTAAAALQVGDEVYYEGPSYPNKGYRIGESTVGARIMQVVRRTDTPAGPLLKLSDSGLAAQPATAPVITIAKFTGSPTTTASFTITNAATLNASGVISVVVEYASGASTPTGAAEFARYLPNTIPTGAILLPPRSTAGETMYVRARSEQAGLRPSAWTAFASVALDAIPAITPFAIGTTTQTSAEISWTNTSSTLPIVVFAIASGSAPANWAPYRLASIPPGSTSTIVRTLTGPSITWTIGVAYESAGILGPVTSASVTTNSTLGITGRPAGLQVIAGLDDVTQTQGIALALWPADQTLDVVIERSATTGTGFAEIARVAGSTPTYVDERPRDGVTYYYRTAHVLGGFGLSPYTREVSAIARGVGRDLVRPDAVTPVVQVATEETSTTGTVTLTVSDPQGRVTQVRFRHSANGGPVSGWTVDTTVPYSYAATIPSTGFLQIEYEVNGYSAAGLLGLLAGGTESFDADRLATLVSVLGTFTNAGAFELAVNADSDTASIRVATSTVSQPTLATTQAATAINQRSYVTSLAGPFLSGATVYVSALAYTAVSGGGTESALFTYQFTRDSTAAVPLAARARVTSTTATTQVVRVAVADPLAAVVSVLSIAVSTVTTNGPHNQTGTFSVIIAGNSNGAYNGTWTATVVNATTFTISTTSTSGTGGTAAPQDYVTIAYSVTGLATPTQVGGAALPSPVTVTPQTTLSEAAGTFYDFELTRPATQQPPGRINFTVTATNRAPAAPAASVVAQDIIGPSLKVVTTPGASSFSLAVTFTGTPSYSLDGVAQSTTGWTSPETVVITRGDIGANAKVAAFSVAKDGSTTSESVNIPPKDITSASITIGAQQADDPTDTYEFDWTTSGFPAGITYDLNYRTVTTGGVIEEGYFTGLTLTNQDVVSGSNIGANPTYQMTVSAVLSGAVLMSRSRTGTFLT